jgi:hypothetical protein
MIENNLTNLINLLKKIFNLGNRKFLVMEVISI